MTMKLTYLSGEQDLLDFAKEAADRFSANPSMTSYSYSEIGPESLVALRWGLDKDCVLVIKLDEYFEPVIYQQVIKKNEGE